jgi:aryl-alcohol dehydrogenase-like predicted oxidoreductase
VINRRTLGRTGLLISEIGYGAWGLGGYQWRGHVEDDALGALRRALELGLNFIDTALAYNDGHSEKLIAKTLAETGAPCYVATKVPPRNRIWPAQPGIGLDDVFPYNYIVESTETSLKNLGVDCLDLQQFHVWNPEWVERDEQRQGWTRAIEDLKQAGKVRFFGISINDHQPASALSAIRTGLIDTVQVIYNVFDQTPENELFPLCQELNIGVLARCPLDEGALTGSITVDTEFDPQEFRAWYFRDNRKQLVVNKVNSLIADLNAAGVASPLAQTALRFCISHPAVTTVIPGMRKIRNVEQNMAVSFEGPLEAPIKELLRRHAWNKNFYS